MRGKPVTSESVQNQLFTAHTQSKHGLSQHAGDIKDIPARENDKRVSERDKSLRMDEKSEAFIINSMKHS